MERPPTVSSLPSTIPPESGTRPTYSSESEIAAPGGGSAAPATPVEPATAARSSAVSHPMRPNIETLPHRDFPPRLSYPSRAGSSPRAHAARVIHLLRSDRRRPTVAQLPARFASIGADEAAGAKCDVNPLPGEGLIRRLDDEESPHVDFTVDLGRRRVMGRERAWRLVIPMV